MNKMDAHKQIQSHQYLFFLPFAFCFFLFAFCISLSGCSRLAVKKIAQLDAEVACMAGVSAERRSYTPLMIDVPLQEVARFKLSSAPGQHLCANPSLLLVPTLDGRLSVIDLKPVKAKSKKKIIQRKKLSHGHAGTIAIAEHSLLVAMRFGKETLMRYNLRDGSKLWEIDAGDIASEPLVADSSVYVTALYKHVDAYRLKDGTRRWQFRTEAQLHASPALSQGILIAACDDGKVYGLEALSGKKLWQFDCGEPVLATPAIHQDLVFVGSAGENIFALNLQDGALRWKNKIGAKVAHAPAVNDSLVIFGSGDSQVRAFDINNGSLRWAFRAGSVIGTSPLIVGDLVFVGSLDRFIYGLDTHSGAVVWQQELEGRVRTNPIIAGAQLVVASEDRYVYVFGKAAMAGTN
jgi:outer membrane protein assembly factor BamB